jgi:SAM-dependent methyltransferase
VRRSYEKEMMDLPGNKPDLLAEDLCNLRILNRYLCGRRCVILGLQRALRRDKLNHFSLLDIGTGSADIPEAILAWGKIKGVDASIIGLEAEPLTARIAARRMNDSPAITIIQADAGAPPFLPRSFDFVVASQFLHHFPDETIVELLGRWAKLARKAIVISDLIRHPVAYHGIRLLTSLTTRNIMTRTDAPLSVQRALTFKEWRSLLMRAAIGPVEMFSVFPFRMAACVHLEGH